MDFSIHSLAVQAPFIQTEYLYDLAENQQKQEENHMILPQTRHCDRAPPELQDQEFSVQYYNLLRPIDELRMREAFAVNLFEKWAANGFKDGKNSFLVDATFAKLGEDNLAPCVAIFTENVYARAKLNNPLHAKEEALAFISSYDQAIAETREFAEVPGRNEIVVKRARYLIARFEHAKANMESMFEKLDRLTPEALQELLGRFLSRYSLPQHEWPERRKILKMGFERYIERAGDRPWVLALQEVTPQVLDALNEDLACEKRNIHVINYNFATGQPSEKFRPGDLDLANTAISVTMLVSDRLDVLKELVFELPPVEVAKNVETQKRLVLAAVLKEKLTGKQLIVLTTHTDWRMSQFEYAKVAARVQEIYRELAKDYPNTPMIFGGDMNMFQQVDGVEDLYKSLREVFPVDFRDQVLYSPHELRLVSFTGLPGEQFNPRFNEEKGEFEANSLDQVVARDVEVVYGARNIYAYDPIAKELASMDPANRSHYLELFKEGHYASDHVSQEIVFKTPQKSL